MMFETTHKRQDPSTTVGMTEFYQHDNNAGSSYQEKIFNLLLVI